MFQQTEAELGKISYEGVNCMKYKSFYLSSCLKQENSQDFLIRPHKIKWNLTTTEECNHYLSLAPWMFGEESPQVLVANPPLPLLLLSGIRQVITIIPVEWNSHLVSLCSGWLSSSNLILIIFFTEFMILVIIYLKNKDAQFNWKINTAHL